MSEETSLARLDNPATIAGYFRDRRAIEWELSDSDAVAMPRDQLEYIKGRYDFILSLAHRIGMPITLSRTYDPDRRVTCYRAERLD